LNFCSKDLALNIIANLALIFSRPINSYIFHGQELLIIKHLVHSNFVTRWRYTKFCNFCVEDMLNVLLFEIVGRLVQSKVCIYFYIFMIID